MGKREEKAARQLHENVRRVLEQVRGKDDERNKAALASFTAYCEAHPQQRFWQALRNWSVYDSIVGVTSGGKQYDTFNVEGLMATRSPHAEYYKCPVCQDGDYQRLLNNGHFMIVGNSIQLIECNRCGKKVYS
jgi:hypothetical protein